MQKLLKLLQFPAWFCNTMGHQTYITRVFFFPFLSAYTPISSADSWASHSLLDPSFSQGSPTLHPRQAGLFCWFPLSTSFSGFSTSLPAEHGQVPEPSRRSLPLHWQPSPMWTAQILGPSRTSLSAWLLSHSHHHHHHHGNHLQCWPWLLLLLPGHGHKIQRAQPCTCSVLCQALLSSNS